MPMHIILKFDCVTADSTSILNPCFTFLYIHSFQFSFRVWPVSSD